MKFAKFWHITCISTTNRRKVINSQKQSGFLAHPCIIVSAVKAVINASADSVAKYLELD